MVTANYLLNKYSKYQEEFYINNDKLLCIICKHVINHNKKSNLDDHVKSKGHINNKKKLEEDNQELSQTAMSTSEKQEINFDLVKAFATADIPLEKVEKLRSFFLKYCNNGKFFFKKLQFYKNKNLYLMLFN